MVNHLTDAATWRDLADELTVHQFDELARHEAKHPDEQGHLLVEAQSYAEENREIQAVCANVPIPDGATIESDSREWFEMWPGSGYRRHLRWANFETTRGLVSVEALQGGDGQFTPAITLYGDHEDMTADDARKMGAALVEAADAMDRLR